MRVLLGLLIALDIIQVMSCIGCYPSYCQEKMVPGLEIDYR